MGVWDHVTLGVWELLIIETPTSMIMLAPGACGVQTVQKPRINYLPGGPVAYNYWLLSDNYGLLWDMVAYYFGLLGVPGRVVMSHPVYESNPLYSAPRAQTL